VTDAGAVFCLAFGGALGCGMMFKTILEKFMLFNAVIEKDEDGYFAHIPELKGCMTQGSTYEEALINIKEAAELYLESLEIEEVKSFQNRLFSITPIEVNYHAHLS
jgi:predicted RNase H-like HicB family nuclease